MLTQVRRLVIHPTDDLRKRVEEHARTNGMTISEIVRRAVDQYVSKKSDTPKPSR